MFFYYILYNQNSTYTLRICSCMFMRSYGGQFLIFCPMCGYSITFIFILTAELTKTSKFISYSYLTLFNRRKKERPTISWWFYKHSNFEFGILEVIHGTGVVDWLPCNRKIMNSRLLSRDSWRGWSQNQPSLRDIESK